MIYYLHTLKFTIIQPIFGGVNVVPTINAEKTDTLR